MKAAVCPAARGSVRAPASKSAAHRHLILAALADRPGEVRGLTLSEDIEATIRCLTALGACIRLKGDTALVTPVSNPPACAQLDCGESGSTLRFLIPVAAALGISAEFTGRGRLPQRPVTGYLEALRAHGVSVCYDGRLPLQISGRLTPGDFQVEGEKSSQYVTGLLLALARMEGGGAVRLTTPLNSAAYVDITVDLLARYGVPVDRQGSAYHVQGGPPRGGSHMVEGDWSSAAFPLCLGALGGCVTVTGLDENSTQGDRAILSILREMGCAVAVSAQGIQVKKSPLRAIRRDMEEIPDLVPVTAVLCAAAQGESVLSGVDRLRYKESDRIASTIGLISSLGGDARYENGCILIRGGALHPGEVASCHDHRIAMAAAVAAAAAGGPVRLDDVDCVAKSYPDFWKDYTLLGGNLQ